MQLTRCSACAKYNLISVSKAVKAGKIVKFDRKYGQIKSKNEELTTLATRIGNLYYLNCCDSRKHCVNISKSRSLASMIWPFRDAIHKEAMK